MEHSRTRPALSLFPDADLSCCFFSLRLRELLVAADGAARAEGLIGQSFFSCVHPDDLDALMLQFASRMLCPSPESRADARHPIRIALNPHKSAITNYEPFARSLWT